MKLIVEVLQIQVHQTVDLTNFNVIVEDVFLDILNVMAKKIV